jgi:hypothetical protein
VGSALRGGAQSGEDLGLGPTPTTSDLVRIDLGGAQRTVVAAEVADGSGVEAAVLLLEGAAVERLVVGGAGAKLEDDVFRSHVR